MCSNSFLSQLTLRTKYHRIQGVRDCLVMDIHHGFFRTFCTDYVWRSPSDSLQCDLRQGMENYPTFGERFVLGLLYEVTVALDTAGTLTLSSLLTSFVHNMCKSAGFIHIRTTIPTPLEASLLRFPRSFRLPYR